MDTPKISEIDGLPALVILAGGWRDDYFEIIRAERLTALSIRVLDNDLGFLRRLTDLRGLVLNGDNIRELRTLEELTDLETLTLNTPRRPRLDLKFEAFPALKRIGLYWNAGFESLFSCASLEELWVFSPPDVDLKRFGMLDSLRRLELSEGRRLKQTTGIERLARLTFLGLYLQQGLQRLAGVNELSSLVELALENCKSLKSIDAVSALTGLNTLKLADCGEISSLRPLANLSNLERFFAWGSTRIADGDLSVLTRLPQLRKIAMRSRREYRPSVEEVTLALSRAP